MNKQPISLQDFESAFQVVVGESIWRVIHPADGWLTIDLGRKYLDTLPGKDGKDEPYDRGQYQIHIAGDWEVYTNGELIESRKVSDDSQEVYFDRMDELVSNFPLTKVESVTLKNEQLIIRDGQSEIKVPISELSESISLSSVELDSHNIPVAYTHYRFDEEPGKLASISTNLLT